MKLSDFVVREDNVVRSLVHDGVDPTDSVPAAVFQSMRQHKDKKVMVDIASGRSWTGEGVMDGIGKAVSVWTDVIGLKKGETVAFYCPNSDWHVINMLAISSIGAVYMSATDSYKYRE